MSAGQAAADPNYRIFRLNPPIYGLLWGLTLLTLLIGGFLFEHYTNNSFPPLFLALLIFLGSPLIAYLLGRRILHKQELYRLRHLPPEELLHELE